MTLGPVCIRPWRLSRESARALRGLAAAAVLLVATSFGAYSDTPVKIDTLSLYVAEPGSTVELDLRISPSSALPKNAYLRIRGLPASATLSDSFAVTAGVWSVPLAALDTLRVTVPKGVSGRSELTISLLDVDGKVLAETRSALVVAQVNLRSALAPEPKIGPKVEPKPEPKAEAKVEARPEPPKAEIMPLAKLEPLRPEAQKPAPKSDPVVEAAPPPEQRVERSAAIEPPKAPPSVLLPAPVLVMPPAAATPPPQASVPPAPVVATAPPAPSQPLSAEVRQRNARMVEQGDKALALGTIAAARQFYLRAADAGDGMACLKLAETYDPVELARLKAQGITGDVAEAVRWYRRAVALGANGAAEKLARVAGR